jgi:hypothetical protein
VEDRGVLSFRSGRGERTGWHLGRAEWLGLAVLLLALIAFGALTERRTALRAVPMTDLGVFARAAWALRHGEDPYLVAWRGWRYRYPPLLAILMSPLEHPSLPAETRTELATEWRWGEARRQKYVPLGAVNFRFFVIVAIWYALSVVLACVSLHALACALEGRRLRDGPPPDPGPRRRWWWRRGGPAVLCLGPLLTVLLRGQIEMVMLAALSLSLYVASRKREWGAGMCLALPAAIKLFPALWFLYPAWRGRWRVLGGAAAGLTLALVVVPVLALGPARTASVYHSWLTLVVLPLFDSGTDRPGAHEITDLTIADNQSLLQAIHNWRHRDLPLRARPDRASVDARLTVYAVGAALLALFALVAGRRPQDTAREQLTGMGLLTGIALVVSPLAHHYYAVLMLPLLTALVDAWLDDGRRLRARAASAAVMALFALSGGLVAIRGAKGVGELPLVSLFVLMGAGAWLLRQDGARSRAPGSARYWPIRRPSASGACRTSDP